MTIFCDTPTARRAACLDTCTLGGMTKRVARPRGSVADPVCATFRLERAARKDLQTLAQAAGMSASALIEELIARVERDENGAPVWAHELRNDEELPIDQAA